MGYLTKKEFADRLRSLFVGQDTGEDQMRRGLLGDAMVKIESRDIDEAKRQVLFLASAPELDRYNEVILVSAFKKKWLNLYKKNPVFLAGHVHVGPAGEPTVIGKAVEVYTDDKGLWMRIEFVPNDDLAERYWVRYRGGYMSAVSIGFITHDWEYRPIEGTDQKRAHFTEVEVVELSGVAVGACRSALAKAYAAYSHLDMLGRDASELGVEVRCRLGELIRSAELSGVARDLVASPPAGTPRLKDVPDDLAAKVIDGLRDGVGDLVAEAVEADREETVRATLEALGHTAPAAAPTSNPRSHPPQTGFTDELRALVGA